MTIFLSSQLLPYLKFKYPNKEYGYLFFFLLARAKYQDRESWLEFKL